jgi:hypothetical protein
MQAVPSSGVWVVATEEGEQWLLHDRPLPGATLGDRERSDRSTSTRDDLARSSSFANGEELRRRVMD